MAQLFQNKYACALRCASKSEKVPKTFFCFFKSGHFQTFSEVLKGCPRNPLKLGAFYALQYAGTSWCFKVIQVTSKTWYLPRSPVQSLVCGILTIIQFYLYLQMF